MEYPRLIEPRVRGYLYDTLHRCHEYKSSFYSWVFNITLFVIFILTMATVLYFCKKRKLSPQEKADKMLSDQNYVLSKIRHYQMDQKRQSTMITDLPFTYHPDAGLDYK
jgi:hypothetical protein